MNRSAILFLLLPVSALALAVRITSPRVVTLQSSKDCLKWSYYGIGTNFVVQMKDRQFYRAISTTNALRIEFIRAKLSWDWDTNVDGYDVWYGANPDDLANMVDVGTNSVSMVPEDVGTNYFVVNAYNLFGESDDSNELTNIVK